MSHLVEKTTAGRIPTQRDSRLRASRSTPGTTIGCATRYPGPTDLQAQGTNDDSTLIPAVWRHDSTFSWPVVPTRAWKTDLKILVTQELGPGLAARRQRSPTSPGGASDAGRWPPVFVRRSSWGPDRDRAPGVTECSRHRSRSNGRRPRLLSCAAAGRQAMVLARQVTGALARRGMGSLDEARP